MDAKDRRIRELEDKVAVYEQQMNKINSDLIVLEQAMTNISKEKTKREVELAKKVDQLQSTLAAKDKQLEKISRAQGEQLALVKELEKSVLKGGDVQKHRQLLVEFAQENQDLISDNERLLQALEEERGRSEQLLGSTAVIEREQLKIMDSLDKIQRQLKSKQGREEGSQQRRAR